MYDQNCHLKSPIVINTLNHMATVKKRIDSTDLDITKVKEMY